jgi:hypothetical protein
MPSAQDLFDTETLTDVVLVFSEKRTPEGARTRDSLCETRWDTGLLAISLDLQLLEARLVVYIMAQNAASTVPALIDSEALSASGLICALRN